MIAKSKDWDELKRFESILSGRRGIIGPHSYRRCDLGVSHKSKSKKQLRMATHIVDNPSENEADNFSIKDHDNYLFRQKKYFVIEIYAERQKIKLRYVSRALEEIPMYNVNEAAWPTAIQSGVNLRKRKATCFCQKEQGLIRSFAWE